MQISASDQVAAWLCSLPPEGKHRVRMPLRALARGRGDIKALQGPLEGFNGLRIGVGSFIVRSPQTASCWNTPTHGMSSTNCSSGFWRSGQSIVEPCNGHGMGVSNCLIHILPARRSKTKRGRSANAPLALGGNLKSDQENLGIAVS